MTLLIGPNGGGKSEALRTIYRWCVGDSISQQLVIGGIRGNWPTPIQLESLLRPIRDPERGAQNHRTIPIRWTELPGGSMTATAQLDKLSELLARDDPNDPDDGGSRQLREAVFRPFTAFLNAESRMALAQAQARGDLTKPPENFLTVLYRDEEKRRSIRAAIHRAFGLYLVIDPTDGGSLRLRLSRVPPEDEMEHRLTEQAVAFHREAPLMEDQSDGVKSFVGQVVALSALNHSTILIDEPDAFLHPPLARQLGGFLSEMATERGSRLLCATHSAAFVMGCVESGAEIAVVRLTYDPRTTTGTAVQLPSAAITTLSSDALFRSTRALEGPFHRAVVVCESDSDRAFYEEINRRLLVSDEHRGVADAQFTNAQNWQTQGRLISPLRRLGIPAAAILDFDTLLDREKGNWSALHQAAGIPATDAARFERARARLIISVRSVDRGVLKRQGLAALPTRERRQARRIITSVARFGLFVVPIGELESWVPFKAAKSVWLVRVFQDLRPAPEIPGAHARQLTRFLDHVEGWVADPDRQGMSPKESDALAETFFAATRRSRVAGPGI